MLSKWIAAVWPSVVSSGAYGWVLDRRQQWSMTTSEQYRQSCQMSDSWCSNLADRPPHD